MTINVNLKPGAAKKAARKLPQVPSVGAFSERFKMPEFDKMMTFIIAAWIIGPALIGLMFFTQRAKKAELDTNIAAELADSTKYAQLIAANKTLLARRDTIAMKVNVIQEIDAGRYIWPHIMDELSRALPPFTWLTKVNTVSVPDSIEKLPHFKIEGRAQNNFALSQYMQQLEASPFVRSVKLISNELVREREKLVYAFGLQASYENPPPDIIETIPLFAKEPD
ncbi:MAG TPA: PilN domain-containing protein [Longimicrobiales bacterium]